MARRNNVLSDQLRKETGIIVTFEEGLCLLLEDCKLKNLRPHTIKFYENEIKATVKLLEKQDISNDLMAVSVEVVKRNIVDYMLTVDKRKAVSVNSRLRALRRLYKFLHSERYILFNPLKDVPLLKLDKRIPPTLTTEQIRDLLLAVDQKSFTGMRNFTIILIFIETGIRLNELVGLNVEDYIKSERVIRVSNPKNRKERYVPVQTQVAKRLNAYIELRGDLDSDALFVNVDNTRLSKRKIQEWLNVYANQANIFNIKVSPHVFRYTFVKFAVKSNANLFVVQEMVGHSDLTMLRHYYSVFGEDIQREHRKFSLGEAILG